MANEKHAELLNQGAEDWNHWSEPNQQVTALLSDANTESTARGFGAAQQPSEANPRFAPHDIIGGRYEILRFIGRGAMGEVYEAKDTVLHERVALKIILPQIASNQRALLRFKHEIQLAHKVTHPNVCRIFDVGYHPEPRTGPAPLTMFLTMELLEGETLRERLQRVGRVTTAEALPIIKQVAAGLEAAHRAGVIHRDFKTGNVMLVPADGAERAVVTDFGLAHMRETTETSSTSLSAPDEIVGTPEYMAPEQVKGEPTSPATDVYALGVVMYAMVTGTLPFVAASRLVCALKRLTEPPASPRVHVPELDAKWETVILRCLERDPANRFQRATEAVDELRGDGTGARRDTAKPLSSRWPFLRRRPLAVVGGLAVFFIPALLMLSPSLQHRLKQRLGLVRLPHEERLAVLPFTVVGNDPETKAFADGLTETLTAKLSRLGTKQPLQVVPAGEIRAMGISSPEQARRDFGVNLAVTGSLQRSNGVVRVTPVLVDTTTERQLGGDTIDAAVADPFALQDRVVSSVVAMLAIEPRGQERAILTSQGTLHPASYDYYLQGRGYLQDYQKLESLQSAIAVFKQALAQDPSYAPAHAGLGRAYWHTYQLTGDAKLVDEALRNCERAAELKPDAPEAHSCLGTVHNGTGRYEQAVREFQSAAKLDPTDDDAYRGLAMAYEGLGNSRDAESTYRQAITLRPHYWGGYSRLGAFYFKQARYSEAADMFGQVMALAPDNARGYNNLGAVYLAEGRYADAIPLFERSTALQPGADAYSNLGTVYFQLRRFTDAARAYEKAVGINPRNYVTWGNLADAEFATPGRRNDAAVPCKKAIELAAEELRLNPRNSALMADLADYYSILRDRARALQYLRRALALAPEDPELRSRAAEVYNQLGDTDQAIVWLQKALAAGYSATMIRDTPVLDNLRADPRVQAILEANRASLSL